MADRQKRNLHVVDDQDDGTDQIIEEIMDELNKEDHPDEVMEEKIAQRRRQTRRRIALAVVIVVVVVAAALLFINLQTYTTARVSETYPISSAADSRYQAFQDGVLKYSSDGISYLNQRGEEQWNQSCQIKTPILDVGEKSAVMADKGGNGILVFTKDGLKGEFETTMPIEKVTVSEQGIVGAILKNGNSPTVICYDAAGNILVEHKTSTSGMGYPLDVALSSDGEVMEVTYLYVQEGEMLSRVAYYNFGEAGEEVTDHQVTYKEYNGSIMTSAFFLDDSVSAAVGDNCLTIFKGKDIPKEVVSIDLVEEVQSVFHSDKYIGLILKNEENGGNELRLYNSSGNVVLSKEFTGEYKNVKLAGDQVILYDGRDCSIFMRDGIQRFEGAMDNNILEIFPIFGVNRYIVVNANGMEIVRLVK